MQSVAIMLVGTTFSGVVLLGAAEPRALSELDAKELLGRTFPAYYMGAFDEKTACTATITGFAFLGNQIKLQIQAKIFTDATAKNTAFVKESQKPPRTFHVVRTSQALGEYPVYFDWDDLSKLVLEVASSKPPTVASSKPPPK